MKKYIAQLKCCVMAHKAVSLLLAAVLLGGAVLVYQSLRPKGVTSYSPEFEAEQSREEGEADEGGVSAGIKIPGYTTIKVSAGTKDVSVDLQNPEENNVYFEISFYLPETDEVIYTSKLIKPGQHLYDIALERELEPGTYDLTIQYATYSMDDTYSPRNGAEVKCKLEAI